MFIKSEWILFRFVVDNKLYVNRAIIVSIESESEIRSMNKSLNFIESKLRLVLFIGCLRNHYENFKPGP